MYRVIVFVFPQIHRSPRAGIDRCCRLIMPRRTGLLEVSRDRVASLTRYMWTLPHCGRAALAHLSELKVMKFFIVWEVE